DAPVDRLNRLPLGDRVAPRPAGVSPAGAVVALELAELRQRLTQKEGVRRAVGDVGQADPGPAAGKHATDERGVGGVAPTLAGAVARVRRGHQCRRDAPRAAADEPPVAVELERAAAAAGRIIALRAGVADVIEQAAVLELVAVAGAAGQRRAGRQDAPADRV